MSPGLPVSLKHDDHRLVHQALQKIEHGALRHVSVHADCFRGVHAAALSNHGEATEQCRASSLSSP